MDLTISRPVRIFALVALIAAVGGGAMLMLKPKGAAAPPVVVRDATAAPATMTHPAATTTAKPRTSEAKPPVITSRPPKHAATPAKAPAAKAPAAAKPKGAVTVAAVAANGLPTVLVQALRTHRIVVVSVFDPESQTDAVSYAEAKAGAEAAGVGFVGISVLDSVTAGALTTALPGGGLLPSPGVLIYRRPDLLVYRIDGFADRDTVAQAAVASVTATPLGG